MDLFPSVEIATNGIRLHAVTAGAEDAPPVILLHGFPEFWYSWRKQIQPLADAGYRVIAPDQRGYNRSDRPAGVGSYQLDILVEDIVGLLDHFGYANSAVVGHDWGALVAWALAIQYPERVSRLVILNVPHPGIPRRKLRMIPGQLLKSWYIAFFQIPGVAEFLLSRARHAALARSLLSSSRPGTFRPSDLELYRQAWSQPGALTAMINWYRALVRMPPAGLAGARVQPPVRMLWGVKDVALSRELAAFSIDLCEDGRLTYYEDATHWVHHEEPDAVNREIIAFLNDEPAKEASPRSRYPQPVE